MIISTDTDSNWLPMFRNLSNLFHQVLLVPVYQDGGTCGGYPGERKEAPTPQELEFAGKVSRGLKTNRIIHTPHPPHAAYLSYQIQTHELQWV